MKFLRLPLALAAVMTLLLVGAPASADGTHTSMDFTCADPSPNTTDTPATNSCTFDFNDSGDFGTTDNDKVDYFEIVLPDGAQINEDNDQGGNGSDGVADPADGDDVGYSTVRTELSYNSCDDNNNDGGTYTTEWDNDWDSYTVPNGWTKVAEYNTIFSVLFFFTRHVPSHVLVNDTTGQYKIVTDLPEADGCAGAHTKFNPLVTYAHADNDSNNTWISKTPTTGDCYTVTITATEVGGTTHTDTDVVDVGGQPGC
ncbi:MAG TPA: hypothetical protein VNU01_12780 [Egibacteraceae bacterium]|nr:hypothetical protein [Egibacteraceae bacterium]